MGVGYAPFVFLFGVLMGTGSSITTKVSSGNINRQSEPEIGREGFDSPRLLSAL